jgi:hypothetical protein
VVKGVEVPIGIYPTRVEMIFEMWHHPPLKRYCREEPYAGFPIT